MKVALLLFPISAEGGLATRGLDTVAVLREHGHEANFYRVVGDSRKHMTGLREPAIATTRSGARLVHRYLSLSPRCHLATLAHLSGYDLLVFLHPCPHRGDAGSVAARWRDLYTETPSAKVVTFSDVYWDRYYPHVRDVVGRFRPLAVNSAVARHVAPLFGGVEPPLTTRPMTVLLLAARGPQRRRLNTFAWTSAWRGWKGIRAVVEAFAASVGTDDSYTATLFGCGREEANLAEQVGALRSSSRFHVQGQVPAGEVQLALSGTRYALDLTGASAKYHGHYNQTTLEPWLFGAVPFVRASMVAHSPLPRDGCHVWDDRDGPALGGALRAAAATTERERKAKAEVGAAFLRDFADHAKIVRGLLEGA